MKEKWNEDLSKLSQALDEQGFLIVGLKFSTALIPTNEGYRNKVTMQVSLTRKEEGW